VPQRRRCVCDVTRRLCFARPWHSGCSPLRVDRHAPMWTAAEESGMQESQHPKGALLFMLVYLVTLTALWLNAYLRLWGE